MTSLLLAQPAVQQAASSGASSGTVGGLGKAQHDCHGPHKPSPLPSVSSRCRPLNVLGFSREWYLEICLERWHTWAWFFQCSSPEALGCGGQQGRVLGMHLLLPGIFMKPLPRQHSPVVVTCSSCPLHHGWSLQSEIEISLRCWL